MPTKPRNFSIPSLLVLAFLALGLSTSGIIGIRYVCTGPEVFPKYLGAPLVYARSSLASSLEWHYSIWGVIINTFIWFTGLYWIQRWLSNRLTGTFAFYGKYAILGGLMTFAVLSLLGTYYTIGSGFGPSSNYWHFQLKDEAKAWGMTCQGTPYVLQ